MLNGSGCPLYFCTVYRVRRARHLVLHKLLVGFSYDTTQSPTSSVLSYCTWYANNAVYISGCCCTTYMYVYTIR